MRKTRTGSRVWETLCCLHGGRGSREHVTGNRLRCVVRSTRHSSMLVRLLEDGMKERRWKKGSGNEKRGTGMRETGTTYRTKGGCAACSLPGVAVVVLSCEDTSSSTERKRLGKERRGRAMRLCLGMRRGR